MFGEKKETDFTRDLFYFFVLHSFNTPYYYFY